MDIWSEIKSSFKEGSVITRLIYVNLVIFLTFRLIQVVYFLSGLDFTLIQWFELPAAVPAWLLQPWSILTYMFLHYDFLHILFNLLVLYWFGRIFLDYYTQGQLLGLYLIGGITGGIVYMAAYNLFPVFDGVVSSSLLLGASASIIAIVVAGAVRDPNRGILLFLFGRVRLKYLALFGVISYIIGISTSNAGGNLAHLGGAFAGWLFVSQLGKGRDITAFLSKTVKRVETLLKPRKKVRVVHRRPPTDDYEYNRQKAASQEEINRILEKISQKGYDGLTKQEKETLFRQGK